MLSEKDKRLIFHNKLRNTLGSNNVYFQPPESVKLKYPAVVYSRSEIKQTKADHQL